MNESVAPQTKREIDAVMEKLTIAMGHTEAIDFENNSEQLYVEHLQGSDRDPIRMLAKRIRITSRQSVQFFTGHPGSGKTTELHRLKKELHETMGQKVRVFFLDVKEWMSVSKPVDLASFLLGLIVSWAKEADTVVKQGWVERLSNFLSSTNVIPKDFKIEAPVLGGAKVALQLALQTNDNFRSQLDDAVRKQGENFISQLHAFVKEFKNDLCGEDTQCVIIVDSIEQIRDFGLDQQSVYASLQALFVGDREALRLPCLHMVYSLSPFLYLENTQLTALYGAGVVVNMPSVHVFKNMSAEPDEKGVQGMTLFLAKRFPSWEQVLTKAQLVRIISACGGDLRDYMRVLEVVSLSDAKTLPVADAHIDYALAQIKPPREIVLDSHMQWLGEIERTHLMSRPDAISHQVISRYLASKHVLAYLNGETWYSVHPLLREWVLARTAPQTESLSEST